MSINQGSINISQPPLTSGGGSTPITAIDELSGIQISQSGSTVFVENRLNWFFVQQFGAKGDGTTDDTAAIQAAFDAAGASAQPGSVVYFAPGTYIVSGTITASAGKEIWVMGAGFDSTSSIHTAFDGILFDLPGPAARVTDMEMVFIGTPTASTAISTVSPNFFVKSAFIVNFYNGIVAVNDGGGFIESCGFTDVANHAIDVTALDELEKQLYITTCAFFYSSKAGIAAIAATNYEGMHIADNAFIGEGLLDNGIIMNVTAGFSPLSIMIQGNNFEEINDTYISIVSLGALQGITITGNTFLSSSTAADGIVMSGTGGSIEGVAITGNFLTGLAVAISLTDVTDVSIDGNVEVANTVSISRAGATTINFGLAGDDNGTAPATTVVVPSTNAYGSNAALLTTPDAWTEVIVNGTTYKMPLYL